jgi:hypothetical protein
MTRPSWADSFDAISYDADGLPRAYSKKQAFISPLEVGLVPSGKVRFMFRRHMCGSCEKIEVQPRAVEN